MFGSLLASLLALVACTESRPAAPTGTITLDLISTAASGISYRLRSATITVQGPGTVKVWSTEDAPDQSSLSADVATGDYTAQLAAGWRLMRIDAGSETPVAAVLISDNPAHFTVTEHQRTGVPLRFRLDDGEVDLDPGYDITVTVDEPNPPVIVVANAGAPNQTPRVAPSLTVYPATADGDVAPLHTIAGSHTLLQTAIDLAVVRDRILVCDVTAIVTFSLSASGDVAPIARIAGPLTGLTSAQSIAVSNDEIYVAQDDTISVFPLTATGDVAPIRTIHTGVGQPFHMVIAGDEIFSTDTTPQVEAQVKVFPASAIGDTQPTRIMRWVPLPDPAALGIAVRGAEVFVLTGSAIDVLPVDANGVIVPPRSLSPISGAFQLAAAHNLLYVAHWSSNSVDIFAPDASGTVAPSRTIHGPSTQLAQPLAVFAN